MASPPFAERHGGRGDREQEAAIDGMPDIAVRPGADELHLEANRDRAAPVAPEVPARPDKSNLVWHKVRKDGGSDGRGVGFYFRNVTELMLFGVRGRNARTRDAGRRQVNYLATRKREHSRKPDEQYSLIKSCSYPPYIKLPEELALLGRVGAMRPMKHTLPDWPTSAHAASSQIGTG